MLPSGSMIVPSFFGSTPGPAIGGPSVVSGGQTFEQFVIVTQTSIPLGSALNTNSVKPLESVRISPNEVLRSSTVVAAEAPAEETSGTTAIASVPSSNAVRLRIIFPPAVASAGAPPAHGGRERSPGSARLRR